MKTREEIITSMCYTFRHDYGLRKQERTLGDFVNNITSGMTEREAKFLWSQMAQIFDNDILPVFEEYGIKF